MEIMPIIIGALIIVRTLYEFNRLETEEYTCALWTPVVQAAQSPQKSDPKQSENKSSSENSANDIKSNNLSVKNILKELLEILSDEVDKKNKHLSEVPPELKKEVTDEHNKKIINTISAYFKANNLSLSTIPEVNLSKEAGEAAEQRSTQETIIELMKELGEKIDNKLKDNNDDAKAKTINLDPSIIGILSALGKASPSTEKSTTSEANDAKPVKKPTENKIQIRLFPLPFVTTLALYLGLSKVCLLYYIRLSKLLLPKFLFFRRNRQYSFLIVGVTGAVDIKTNGDVHFASLVDVILLFMIIFTYHLDYVEDIYTRAFLPTVEPPKTGFVKMGIGKTGATKTKPYVIEVDAVSNGTTPSQNARITRKMLEDLSKRVAKNGATGVKV